MPTAARLIAAVCLALLAWYTSGLIMPLMEEGTQFGLFSVVNAGLGALAGWQVVGTRVGFGYRPAMGAGLTGTLTFVIWGLVVHSIVIMIEKSLGHRYKGPTEAVIDVFNLGLKHALVMYDLNVIMTLVVGGLIAGIIAEWSSRRWA